MINVFLCFMQKLSMSTKNDRTMIFCKKWQVTLPISYTSKISRKYPYLEKVSEINMFLTFYAEFQDGAKNFGENCQITLQIP